MHYALARIRSIQGMHFGRSAMLLTAVKQNVTRRVRSSGCVDLADTQESILAQELGPLETVQ